LTADLRKTALQGLVAFRPTHLILDFIDERFDLARHGPALFTHSWELEASGYLSTAPFEGTQGIPRLSQACERLWAEGVAEFAALMATTPLRSARLILHRARWADHSRDSEGRLSPLRDVEVLPDRPASIAAHNRLLERYETLLAAVLPYLAQVEAPALRIADANHRWGLSPFHYVPEYYEAIWLQLQALGIERPAGQPA
jgi:hypothetical protein